ncbi:fluoride efflux transporter CrcB [Micrococcaceae bacterium Sec5.8]
MIMFLLTLAGAAGAATRFIVDSLVRPKVPTPLPLSTMAINVSGSLLLGVLAGAMLAARGPAEWQTIIGTGFLGGFTTFSTASVETIRLIQSRRSGLAAVYSLGTLVLSLTAAATGMALGRIL